MPDCRGSQLFLHRCRIRVWLPVLFVLLARAASGQMSPPPLLRLLDHENVFDAFVIGKVVTVYRTGSLPQGTDANDDLTKMLAVDRAAIHGEPDEITRSIVASQCFRPMRFDLREAAAINLGDSGYVWRITWTLSPEQGGMTGVPYQYRSYVASDGSLIGYERVFCDAYLIGQQFDNLDDWLVSHLPFSEFSGEVKDGSVVHGDEIKSRVEQKLKSVIAAQNAKDGASRPGFRFRDQSLIEVPVKQRHDGTIVSRKVWTVHFVSETAEKRAIIDANPLRIWATVDGRISELTLGQWSLKRDGLGE